ncbi:craniofacial development protein 2-like [Elysia marginata]|uniref:Craniofacial development protein 2-like n=1 Tax=Elysia marginata TaxID=1093978 RepID=A0AAV4IW79_9GAST|nr:craniofacial development protein 2-like [Elysia marginata]
MWDDKMYRRDVALIFDREANQILMALEPINHSIIRSRLYSGFEKLTIVQCCAPTEDAADGENDEFYSELQEILAYIPKHDITIVMGDINAKIGSDNTMFEEYIGKHGLEVKKKKTSNNKGRFV